MAENGIKVQAVAQKTEFGNIWISLVGSKMWTGYIWLSGETEPRIFDKESIPEIPSGQHIHEVNLVVETESGIAQESLSVVFREGVWNIVHRLDENGLPSGYEKTERKVLASSPLGTDAKISGLRFSEYFIPQTIRNPQSFSVLKPAWFVFEGFFR